MKSWFLPMQTFRAVQSALSEEVDVRFSMLIDHPPGDPPTTFKPRVPMIMSKDGVGPGGDEHLGAVATKALGRHAEFVPVVRGTKQVVDESRFRGRGGTVGVAWRRE